MPKPRIMYIENKSNGEPGRRNMVGPARIGLVTFSRSGLKLYYGGRSFTSMGSYGRTCFKANYRDTESGEHYWISGPRRDGEDGLYGYRPTPIDEDVREEYWTLIRRKPENKHRKKS